MAMTEDQMLEALQEAGAILSGHFVLTSGRHSDTYVQCARILEDPLLTTRLAISAAEKVRHLDADIVAAPAVGGIIIGFAVAQALELPFIFAERQDGRMIFRRGFEIPEGSRVLVVEDVVTTGGSVAEVIEQVEGVGGNVPAVTSIIDRGGDKAFSQPLFPLLRVEVASWDPSQCDLCEQGLDTHSPGSRRL